MCVSSLEYECVVGVCVCVGMGHGHTHRKGRGGILHTWRSETVLQICILLQVESDTKVVQ